MKKNLSQKELVSFITYLSTYLDLTTKMKRVWKYLKKLHTAYQFVFPCYTRIAKECKCCRDTVFRAIKRFQELGWLVKIRLPYCSNRYELDPRIVDIEVGPIDKIAIKNLRKYEKEYFEKYPPSPSNLDDEDFREENRQKSDADQTISSSGFSLSYNRLDSTTQNGALITNAALQPLMVSDKYTRNDLKVWNKYPEYVINQAISQRNFILNNANINKQPIRNEAALMNMLLSKADAKYKSDKNPPPPKDKPESPPENVVNVKQENINYVKKLNTENTVIIETNKPLQEIQVSDNKVNIIIDSKEVTIMSISRGRPLDSRSVWLDLDFSRFEKLFESSYATISFELNEKIKFYERQAMEKERTRAAIAQRNALRAQGVYQ